MIYLAFTAFTVGGFILGYCWCRINTPIDDRFEEDWRGNWPRYPHDW